jgi:LmbE family N-acetylglucosaminyl deacetylase
MTGASSELTTAAGERLTIMAVHAHPDDEASSTGGILARYSREGIRTVLVTCTNGELGNAADGTGPGDPGHDGTAVARHRREELDRSCELLGISDLELLGYHDSGMMGWPQNDAPHAFWNTPIAEAAGRLGELMKQYKPQVVVTYDENGFYGHPDHIQAHRITVAAVEATSIPQKLYFPVIPLSAMGRFVEVLQSAGVEPPPEATDATDFGTPDELIAAVIDCSEFSEIKFRALEAHSSQTDNSFFLNLGLGVFKQVFGVESFVRAHDTTGSPIPENDLFAGIR